MSTLLVVALRKKLSTCGCWSASVTSSWINQWSFGICSSQRCPAASCSWMDSRFVAGNEAVFAGAVVGVIDMGEASAVAGAGAASAGVVGGASLASFIWLGGEAAGGFCGAGCSRGRASAGAGGCAVLNGVVASNQAVAASALSANPQTMSAGIFLRRFFLV